MNIVILMPVYEDWDAALALCQRIDVVFLNENSVRASVLLIDDGSVRNPHPREISLPLQAIEKIAILVLRRNLGHQRAIAIGLAHVQKNWKADAVLVMDADGEDQPEDIPALISAMRKSACPTAVFAERGKRLESATFRTAYFCYRIAHRFLTGRDIRFGNFSVLPWQHLESLVLFPELWNHYAATFLKSALPYVRVPSDRAKRLTGRSHMNFVSLLVHGLSALFANQEVVVARLMLMILAATAIFFLAIGVVIGVRLLTDWGIPGWATSTMGLLLLLVGQSLIACFLLVFSIMMNRNQLGFLPVRDYEHFVRGEIRLFSR